jgi:MarR family transcriptional regulator, transcriptional regulator for hemolysin
MLQHEEEENQTLLGGSIGFLLSTTSRKVSLLLSQRLKEFDISPEQWSVLYHIADCDAMIQKEIAARSGKDRPTVTRILDALEAKGLIRKEAGAADRRSFQVTATEKGKELAARAFPVEDGMNEELIAELGHQDYELLVRLLNRVEGFTQTMLRKEKEIPHE